MSADPSSETKTRLLDAAEGLFADYGFRGTSLRQITQAAEANIAAVNYHFESKDGLLRAVFERRLLPLNDERIRRLEALQAAGDPAGPALREILTAFIEPALRLRELPGGPQFLRLLGRAQAEPERSPIKELLFGQFEVVARRFLPVMRTALPQLDEVTRFWRLHFMVGSMVHTMMCADAPAHFSDGKCDISEFDRVLGLIVDFAEAGLTAPVRGDSR